MRRGEIRLVNLDPVVGSESNKLRPCVIVSNNNANDTAEILGRGVVTVVPLTSNTVRVYPFQTLLDSADTGLGEDSKAQAEQVRSVDVRRIGKKIGQLSMRQQFVLDEALRLHLQL